jgi:probable F420-dependent oxidoreductase
MIDAGKMGVWYGADKLNPIEWKRFINAVETLGYSALWYSESRGFESMSFGSYLLSISSKIKIGSSIASIYARDAAASRNGMRTLNAISNDRYILGLGVSHAPMVEGMRGHSYGKPLSTMRNYLQMMRKDETDANDWPLVIAALGPKMLELSGELTQGAVPYNVTPGHTARAKAILGPNKLLAVEQKVCLETDPTKARALARNELSRYMPMVNYRNSWYAEGFTDADLADGGNDRFLDAMVVWGTQQTIEQRIKEHYDAGATHVCIQPVHPAGDLDAAIRVLETFAPNS